MKKTIIFLYVLFLSSIIIAQNFDFIGPSGIYYYHTDKLSDEAFEIDRIIENDSGIWYYPKTTYGNIIPTEEYPRARCDVNTSFFGDSIFIKSNGDSYFFNRYGNRLYFKRLDNFKELAWTLHKEENGACIKAHYSSFESFTLFNEETIIIKINLTVYDSLGNVFENHTLNNRSLKLHPLYGFIDVFSFRNFRSIYYQENDDFPSRLLSFTLNAIETDNELLGEDYLTKVPYQRILKSIDIGNIIHYIYKEYDDEYQAQRIYTDKSIQNNMVFYTYDECIINYGDTTRITKSEYFHLDLGYQEIFFDTITNHMIGFNRYSLGTSVNYLNSIRFTFWRGGGNIEGATQVGITPNQLYSHMSVSSEYFVHGLGHFRSRPCEECYGDKIVYYKTPWEEWGTQLDFECKDFNEINELLDLDFQVYPNPIKDYIKIVSTNHKIKDLGIYDVSGNLVLSESLAHPLLLYTLQTKALKPGTYILEILTPGGQIIRKKIQKI